MNLNEWNKNNYKQITRRKRNCKNYYLEKKRQLYNIIKKKKRCQLDFNYYFKHQIYVSNFRWWLMINDSYTKKYKIGKYNLIENWL